MPPQSTQRRRRTGNQEEENHARRRQSRRAPESDEESEASGNDEDQDEDIDMDRPAGADGTPHDQLVKKLVRYALACEYARIPIKRDGIRDKVLGGANARSFRRVFDDAQEQLQKVFGMEMAELPVREKRTLKEKQKASKRSTQAPATSRQYILTSSLPKAFRTKPIIGPSRIPSAAEEAAYVAFYTIVISLITLSGGELRDVKLRRHLTRLNALQNLPMDKTENVLVKMVRQGYVDKVVERVEGDEDSITWHVGPRGKIEVSNQSIAHVVAEMWGDDRPDDFDKKLEKSLGVRISQARGGNKRRAEEDEEAG